MHACFLRAFRCCLRVVRILGTTGAGPASSTPITAYVHQECISAHLACSHLSSVDLSTGCRQDSCGEAFVARSVRTLQSSICKCDMPQQVHGNCHLSGLPGSPETCVAAAGGCVTTGPKPPEEEVGREDSEANPSPDDAVMKGADIMGWAAPSPRPALADSAPMSAGPSPATTQHEAPARHTDDNAQPVLSVKRVGSTELKHHCCAGISSLASLQKTCRQSRGTKEGCHLVQHQAWRRRQPGWCAPWSG